ncbi:MAG: hypothetical protein IPL52_06035 [Flavobacteriales bacterium]|nr:hypothetical protein [Flavobacteriales bacterium]
MDDRTRMLTTNSFDPVWNTELYELPVNVEQDGAPSYEQFSDSGQLYCLKDWVVYEQVDWYLSTERHAAQLEPKEWYGTVRPRLVDSLFALYPWDLKPFNGHLHLTGDTVWQWLENETELEGSANTRTLAQLLKPGHWYLFVFDVDGRHWSDGGRYNVERRVLFRIDDLGEVQDWQSTRKRVRKMRIV